MLYSARGLNESTEAMSSKDKNTSTRKKKPAARRTRRNPSGVTLTWGGDDLRARPANGNGGARKKATRPKRNPAKLPAEDAEARKANELMLRAWERIYAKRQQFRKLN